MPRSDHPVLRLAACCVLALATAGTFAADKLPSDPSQDPMMTTAGFLASHPDLRYRLLGLEKLKAGRASEALEFFKHAAFYADKPSQGMVAEMLWNGQGTATDRALAYAWMDLAAERGYRGFGGLRERYWGQLNAEEQARAVDEGQAVYAKYGDEAAKPRLAKVLRRERLRMTGSRLGNAGNLKIYIPGPDGEGISIDGSKFYDPRYWNPELYQQWHDQLWMNPRIGTVNVGQADQIDRSRRIPDVEPDLDAPAPADDKVMPEVESTRN